MEATIVTALVTVGIEKIVKLIGGLLKEKPWINSRRSRREAEEMEKLLLEIQDDINGLNRVFKNGCFDSADDDKHNHALVDLSEELKKFEKDLRDIGGRIKSVKLNELQALRRQIGRSFREHVIKAFFELNKDVQQLHKQVIAIKQRDVQYSNNANFSPQQYPLNINIGKLLVQFVTTQDPSNNQMINYKVPSLDYMDNLKLLNNYNSKGMVEFIEEDSQRHGPSNNQITNCKAPSITPSKIHNGYNTTHSVECIQGDYTLNDDETDSWDDSDIQVDYAHYNRFWEHNEDVPFDHSNRERETIDNIFDNIVVYFSN